MYVCIHLLRSFSLWAFLLSSPGHSKWSSVSSHIKLVLLTITQSPKLETWNAAYLFPLSYPSIFSHFGWLISPPFKCCSNILSLYFLTTSVLAFISSYLDCCRNILIHLSPLYSPLICSPFCSQWLFYFLNQIWYNLHIIICSFSAHSF